MRHPSRLSLVHSLTRLFIVLSVSAVGLSADAQDDSFESVEPPPEWANTALVMKGSMRTVDAYDSNGKIINTVRSLVQMFQDAGLNPSGDGAIGFAYEPLVEDFTVAIKRGRLRLDIGGSSLLAGPDGWAVLDPATGRIVKQAAFNPEPLHRSMLLDLLSGEARVSNHTWYKLTETPKVSGGQVTKVIAGHATRQYDYSFQVLGGFSRTSLSMTLRGGGHNEISERIVDIRVYVDGTVWIAESGPYLDDPALSVFFDNMGDQLLTGSLVIPSGEFENLVKRGPIFAQEESTDWTIVTDTEGENLPLVTSEYSFELKNISREPMDDDRFSGFEKPKQQCDCSCEAWERMKAIGKGSKQDVVDNPETMALSMCAPKCALDWIACEQVH